MRSFARSLVPGVALIALLVGCAPAQPTTPAAPKASGPAASQPAQSSAPAPPAQASGPAEWVVAVSEEAGSLDPGSGGAVAASTQAHTHLYDALISYEPPNFTVVPLLAESWTVLDDQTWEFRLRRGVKFHNGDDFDARDFLYSVEVYRQPGGPRAHNLAAITGVEQVDPYTIRITTSGPSPTLLANLSYIWILPREAREKVGSESFAQQPIGTGPYRLVEFTRGQRLVLEANPNYWRGRVTPQKLTLRTITDPATRVAELKTGGVQLITSPPAAQLRELQSGDTEVISIKGARLIMHSFNTTARPFDDVRVRQAVNYAVDRESIIKNVLEGHAEPLHGPFSTSWLGYDPNIKPYSYDPARARQLLAEAGYPNGLDTVFNHSTGAFLKDREIAEVVASQLGQVGIRVRLVPTERAKIQEDWLNGTFEGITSAQWPTASDPDPMIGWTLYKRKGHKPDDQLNGLIDQSRATVDPEQRKRILQELSRYMHDQAYWLFIHAQDDFLAKRKDLPWELSPTMTFGALRFYRLGGS
jgi:peptide/nickel transport system substrate-binding protein